jgi:mevalonate kinase
MAPAFMVSAPGKVILFGEHAVVYGRPAIAAAISLRSYLLVTTLSKSQRTITLNFRDIGLNYTWNIPTLPWDIFHKPSKRRFYHSLVTSLDPELYNAIIPHAEAVSMDLPDEQRKIHVRSATAFLYLFLSLGSKQSPGAIYTLRSTIPIGAGLGSSASVCVCLSAAFLLQIRALTGPHPDQPPEEAEVQIERVNRWAFVGELCTHGDPSGLDNTISTGGKAVIFQRNDFESSSITPLTKFPKLRLLLVDTRQPRSTAAQVKKVTTLKSNHPILTEWILDGIGKLTTSALEFIESADCDENDLEHLGTLIRFNHGLLVSLGVSHPRLERIRELVDYADIGWTKLTGAGGGGCAITIFRPGVKDETIKELEQNFITEGFQKYETILGAEGIGVLWPAVFPNGTDEDGGKEIDQEKFENAIGAQGVEQLVGVGVQGNREGWKFWR